MADTKGWICLHRKIQECSIWDSDEKFDSRSAWIDLLLLANHEDKKTLFDGKPVVVKRGQRITSVRQLADRWHWGNNKTLKYLRMLEEEKMIVKESDKRRTLITIVNYRVYNDMPNTDGTQTEHKRNTDGTLTEHKRNTDEPQTTMNNNENNENNETKNNNIPPSPLRGEKPKAEKKSNVKMFNGFMDANQNNGLSEKVRNALLDWMEYKDQRKDYYADKGMQSLLNKALNKEKEYGADAVVEVIGDSMASNYQGITWDALEKRKSKKLVTSTQDEWDEWRARREKEKNG